MTVVKVHELTKCFGEHEVFKSTSLEFEQGKIYGLVGRNGSGKSVMLKCIAGLMIPSSGYVEVFGKRIGRDVDFAPHTGIVIEQSGLLLKQNARTNMRTLAALTHKPDNNQIDLLLENVGLNPCEKKPVGTYSMGMKQKLSIAMALLGDPQLLLLDEPMSNLDSASAEIMRKLFSKLAKDGKTILIATHIQDDLRSLCENVCYFCDGEIKTG